MSNEIKRRDFLKMLSLSIAANSSLAVLFDSMLAGLTRKALAQTSSQRRYVYIQQGGAPARWSYDLFLTPYSSTGFSAPGDMGTRFATGTTYTSTSYQTVDKTYNGKTIKAPFLWNTNIPFRSGARPMADLLANMLSIRGITTGNSSHPASQTGHFRPFGAKYSLPALSAEYSTAPVRAINVQGQNYTFVAPSPLSPTNLAAPGNMLSSLLSPFTINYNGTVSGYQAKRDAMWGDVKNSLGVLNAESIERNPSAEAMANAQEEAITMLARNWGDINSQWTALQNKYQSLINRSLDIKGAFQIPGITDKAVGVTTGRDNRYDLGGSAVTIPDLRDMIAPASDATPTTIDFMADHFAIAEFILVNNISDSVCISPRQLADLRLSSNSRMDQVFDEHGTGSIVSLLTDAVYFRALSACLAELVERTKETNMFDKTAFIVGGEFNRTPGAGGSNHGWQGASVCVYSGIIQGPMVIGNIRNSTWGYGSPVRSTTGADLGVLDLGHLGSTIAAILGVPNPLTSRSPIIRVTPNNLLESLIEPAKQI